MYSTNRAASSPPSPTQQTSSLEVLYENDEMLVVNKPPDMPMDGDVGTYTRTVESMVYEYMKQRGIYDDDHDRLQQAGKRKKQLKFVHQLDYSTSGVLCLAFTKDMAARLAHCFEMRTTRKYYVALLHGHIPENSVATESDQSLKEELSFEQWAAKCHDVWHDIGSVTVDACARYSADKNAEALRGFLYLLNGQSEGETVHRHSGRCGGLSPSDGAASSTAVENSVVYKLLRETCTSSTPSSLTVNLPVGYDVDDAAHFRMAATTENSRHASTSLLVLTRTHLLLSSTTSSAQSVPVTVVLLSPHTGRRHQLRVHCRALGFPIVGDTAYCAALPWCRSVAGTVSLTEWTCGAVPRMYLHAWRLLLPGAATCRLGESERVAMKKKRRRETLGLADRSDAAVSAHHNEWTEFVAPVHFPGVSLEK